MTSPTAHTITECNDQSTLLISDRSEDMTEVINTHSALAVLVIHQVGREAESRQPKKIVSIEHCCCRVNKDRRDTSTRFESNHYRRKLESCKGPDKFTMIFIAELRKYDSMLLNSLEAILSFNHVTLYVLYPSKPIQVQLSHNTANSKSSYNLSAVCSEEALQMPSLSSSNQDLFNSHLKHYGKAHHLHLQGSLSIARSINSPLAYLVMRGSTPENQKLQGYTIQHHKKASPIPLRSRKYMLDCVLEIAAVKNNIGDLIFKRKQYKRAFSFYVQAYQIRRNVLGDIHIDTCISSFYVGKCLHCLGKYSAAMSFYGVFVNSVFSSTNHSLLTKETFLALQSIALLFHKGGYFKFAKKFYKIAHQAAIKLFGKRNKFLSRLLVHLGDVNFDIGNMPEALDYYLGGIEMQNSLQPLTENIDYTIRTLFNVALAYEALNCLEISLNTFNLIVEKIIKTGTRDSKILKKMADILPNLARVYQKIRRPDLALKVLLKTLVTQQLEYGDNHRSVAATLNDIGILYGCQGNTKLALRNFEESYRIRKFLKDPDRDMTTVLFNIAYTHDQNGDYQKAIARFEELVQYELSKREDDSLRNDNQNTSPEALLEALEQISRITSNDLNSPQKALIWCEKGIRIATEEAHLSPNFRSRFLGIAGALCLELGDVKGAMCYFTETTRTNIDGGLAFDANISIAGYECLKLGLDYPKSAAAA